MVACSGSGPSAGGDAGPDPLSDGGLARCTTDDDCDNGAFCDGAERCVGAGPGTDGRCEAGQAPMLDDGVGCTVDACDESSDSVTHTADDAACDDAMACNGTETCSVSLGCQPGAPANDVDMDADGFTPAEGDCDECDAMVNPAAVEFAGDALDNDCSGSSDDVLPTCDADLALADTSAQNGAAAIGICRRATGASDAGLLSASYVDAVGGAVTRPLMHGIQASFGSAVGTLEGDRMLQLSTGTARTPGQPDACTSSNCSEGGAGIAPAGFPIPTTGCATSEDIADDISLEVRLRAPSNVAGFEFYARFTTFDYPQFVCSTADDQFVVLMNPPPLGAIDGNIVLDAAAQPGLRTGSDSVRVCDPADVGSYAERCMVGSCPAAPSPYCPLGASDLAGTGYDDGFGAGETSGGTDWTRVSAPVSPGDEFTLRFAIWDSLDSAGDATVLIDGFAWLPAEDTR